MITNETDNRFYVDINDVREDEDWVQVTISGEGAGKLTETQIARSLALLAGETSQLQKLPAAFEVIDTENGTYLTRSEQAAINAGFEYNGLYRRDGSAPLPVAVKDLDWFRPAELHENVVLMRAASRFGMYEAWGGGGWNLDRGRQQVAPERSLEAAKAACQADFNSRSALSSPVGGMEEQTGLDANGDFVDIVAELRKVAKIETGLLYSRRLMLNQAASDITALREENSKRDANNVGIGMAIAAAILMRVWGKETQAKEILGATGLTTEARLREIGVEDYDLDELRPILDKSGSALQHVARGERG